MKKRSFKIKVTSFLLAMVLGITSIVAVPITASAVSTPASAESSYIPVWADPENTLTSADITQFNAGTKTTMVGAVGVFKTTTSDSGYYLFLPSSTDCNSLKIWYSEAYSSLKIDGTEIPNGQPTGALADANEGGVAKSHTFALTSTSGSTTSYNVTVLKSGDVGTVYIDTESGSISSLNVDDHTTSTTGTIMVVNPDGTIQYDGIMAKMSGRGNGTWDKSNVKNPYNVNLAVSTSLLGMPKAKKWVLLANAGDATLIKNQLTYDFSKYVGVKYQPTCKPVDLYVNQQYYGSYSLSEKVEIKSNRINVSDAYENLEIANGTTDATTGAIVPADLTGTSVKSVTSSGTTTIGLTDAFGCTVGNRNYSDSLTEPSDYTGGLLYELEISQRWMDENAGFCAYNRQGWVLKSCDYASKNMVNYSYDLLYAMGSAVYNGGTVPSKESTTTCNSASIIKSQITRSCTNPAPASQYQGKRWSDILDADSAVRYYWTQEYFKNMDSSTSSTYFYKESDAIDTKVYAGPVWDMDNALCYNENASRWGASYTSSDGWYTKVARIYRWRTNDSTMTYSSDSAAPLNFYAALASNCSDFWTQAESYWYSIIEPATQILLGNKVDPKGILHSTDYYVNTVAKSALMDAYRIKGTSSYDASGIISGINNWLTARNQWINNQIPQADISSATISEIPDQVCTGSAIEPNITITNNGATLTEGRDYTVEFSNNIQVSSVAKAVITGMGYYTGTKTVFFNIVQGNISQVKINPLAYADDTLKTTVITGTDDILTNYCTYQWYADGVEISGATESAYTIEQDKQGSVITVTVKGDGHNFSSTAVTSNECQIQSGVRPEGFSKTIASWDYDYTANADALVNGDTTGTTYFYNATSGENADTAILVASVDAADVANIKWSGSTDLYTNSKTSIGVDRAPIMGTSKTDLLGWGYYPYFDTTVSTVGYEAIKFSAKLGGTNKAPKNWNLQYSLDGVNYVDVPNTSYSITTNKALEDAFQEVSLPAECNDVENLHIRMVVNEDLAINGVNTIVNQLSGDAAVNNITIQGSSTDVVTELTDPLFSTTAQNGDLTAIFHNENVVITDTNGGADIFYTVNGGEEKQYNGPFNPFSSLQAKGEKATITAWARFEQIESGKVTFEVTNAGTAIGEFIFDTYSQNVSNGAVFSTGGIYGESSKMTAVADGSSQYVPLWNEANGAFNLSPDDGAKWSANSGFYFETSTAGYNNICFTAKAYTTARGPKSVKLQYSLNGNDWTDVTDNTALAMNAQLEQLYMTTELPSECANRAKLYIRIATVENLNASGEALHNNESKGNLYINNIVISGTDDATLKMPYTNKTTSYFGSGFIKYYSPDNVPMQYAVLDAKSNVIMSGTYPETGINISTYANFNAKTAGPYTVSVWAGDDDDKSLVNTKKYYYKGETVVKFNYNDSLNLFANYVSEDGLSVSNTSGANSGTLSMSPNGIDKTVLSYTNQYGVKASWASDNMFYSTKVLDNPEANGYWLIKTSTLGYTNTTINLEQISSNKGPRDWGIAYSTDGVSYTYVSNSNVRAISNDASPEPIETYNNLPLPEACDNQEELYIKVFINGGECVEGDELETLLKGNTGINGIEISGVANPENYTVTFKTVAYEDMNRTVGTTPVNANIYINGKAYATENGQLQFDILEGEAFTYYASVAGNTFASDKVTEYAAGNKEIVIPIVALDVTGDGYVNAKDFAKIRREAQYSTQRDYLLELYPGFHNINEEAFNSYTADAV
ncbi:MAG: CotH kinase family protein [Eubacterium sp.]